MVSTIVSVWSQDLPNKEWVRVRVGCFLLHSGNTSHHVGPKLTLAYKESRVVQTFANISKLTRQVLL